MINVVLMLIAFIMGLLSGVWLIFVGDKAHYHEMLARYYREKLKESNE